MCEGTELSIFVRSGQSITTEVCRQFLKADMVEQMIYLLPKEKFVQMQALIIQKGVSLRTCYSLLGALLNGGIETSYLSFIF